MERVAFLVEATNERLRCLLNPATLVMRRRAGLRPRRALSGPVTGAGLSDDPLLYTGGGRTVLELDLLFDVTLPGSSIQSDDVRDLTLPLWQLAENTGRQRRYGQPPQVRFIWGKSWNIPGVIEAVAERFESFTRNGVARRSWLRLRLLRVNDAVENIDRQPSFSLERLPNTAALANADESWGAHQMLGSLGQAGEGTMSGDRLDQVAHQVYGDASYWRLLARANDVDDPARIPAGTLLRVPPLSILGGEG